MTSHQVLPCANLRLFFRRPPAGGVASWQMILFKHATTSLDDSYGTKCPNHGHEACSVRANHSWRLMSPSPGYLDPAIRRSITALAYLLIFSIAGRRIASTGKTISEYKERVLQVTMQGSLNRSRSGSGSDDSLM
jgi:hypothetical protein